MDFIGKIYLSRRSPLRDTGRYWAALEQLYDAVWAQSREEIRRFFANSRGDLVEEFQKAALQLGENQYHSEDDRENHSRFTFEHLVTWLRKYRILALQKESYEKVVKPRVLTGLTQLRREISQYMQKLQDQVIPPFEEYYQRLEVGKTAGAGGGYVEHQMKGLLGEDYGKGYHSRRKPRRKHHHGEGDYGDSEHMVMSGVERDSEHELGVREHGEGESDGFERLDSDRSDRSDQRGSEYSGGLLDRYRVAMDLELADVMGRIEKYEVPWK